MKEQARHSRLSTLDEFLAEIEHRPEEIAQAPSRDLAFLLVELRLALDLNQAEFARLTGVSPAYISKLESGRGNPSIKSLAALLRRAGADLALTATIPGTWGTARPRPRVIDRREEVADVTPSHSGGARRQG